MNASYSNNPTAVWYISQNVMVLDIVICISPKDYQDTRDSMI